MVTHFHLTHLHVVRVIWVIRFPFAVTTNLLALWLQPLEISPMLMRQMSTSVVPCPTSSPTRRPWSEAFTSLVACVSWQSSTSSSELGVWEEEEDQQAGGQAHASTGPWMLEQGVKRWNLWVLEIMKMKMRTHSLTMPSQIHGLYPNTEADLHQMENHH